MLRLGLIGCGEHSESGHAIPLTRYRAAHPEEIELAAACDLDFDRAKNFCSSYGFSSAYRDFEEMLSREKLNACVAVVPASKISALGVTLLHRGIPCLIEKPLGSSLAEVTALRDAAISTRTPNMVSVNRRFMPYLNRALEWAQTAGTLHYVRCTMARHARTEASFIWETAVHAVDALRYLAGDVRSFHARKLNCTNATLWYVVDLEFENQSGGRVAGRIDILPTAGMVEETYELFGEDFRVTVTCPFGSQRGWKAFRDGRLVAEEVESSEIPEDVLNGCYEETAAFIRTLDQQALNSGRALQPSIAEVAPSVELCWAIAQRVNSGAKI